MIITFLNCTFWLINCIHSVTGMHNEMGQKVIRAKILFFDSNPIGRITSRFSTDVAMVDGMFA